MLTASTKTTLATIKSLLAFTAGVAGGSVLMLGSALLAMNWKCSTLS